MIAMGLLLGGHFRVGFEYNIYIRSGEPAKSNAQMLEMVVDLANMLQREVATLNEARQILHIK